jgi:CBS domain containing-hemolysin-like protein
MALLEDPSLAAAAAHTLGLLLWLLAAATCAAGPGRWLGALLERSAYAPVSVNAEALGILIAVTLTGILFILVAESFSRSIAAHQSERIALKTIGVSALVSWLMKPAVRLVAAVAGALLAPFGAKVRLSWPALTEEELMVLVEAGEEEGVIEEDEKEMIDSIFEFTDTVVRQVMVPRIDMKVVDADTPVLEAVSVIMESGHSRLPVIDGNVDTIIGIIHAKDLLPILASPEKREVSLRDIVRPAFFVPENKKVSELLAEFRSNNRQMAIVRDEYGGTAGLVTVEDLIEEIVGEIRDEYDHEEPLITIQDEDAWVVDARLNIDDLNEQLDARLPEDEFETIGGFVFGTLGKEPEVGDSVEFNGWRMTVQEKEGRRLRKIRIEPPREDEEPPTTGEGGKGEQSASAGQSASG